MSHKGGITLKKILLLLFLFLTLTNLSFASETQNKYKFIGANDFMMKYFDTETMMVENVNANGVDTTIVTVWIINKLTEQGVKLNTLNANKIPGVYFVSYQDQYDRAGQKSRFLNIVYYDKYFQIIDKATNTNPEWTAILPGTTGEFEFNSIFTYLDSKNSNQSE